MMRSNVIKHMLAIASTSLLFAISMGAEGLEQRCNDNAATSTPTHRFVKHNQGIVFDRATRLEWQTCVSGLTGNQCQGGRVEYYSWWDAMLVPAAFNASSDGNTDWRLPNIKELYSIIETACEEPSLNKSVFVNHPLSPYISKSWSSTPTSANPTKAWQIEFQNGLLYGVDNDDALTVRLVRTCDATCQQAYDL